MKSRLLLAAIAGLSLSAQPLFAEEAKKTAAQPTAMNGSCHMKEGMHGCKGDHKCDGKMLNKEECHKMKGEWKAEATAPAAAAPAATAPATPPTTKK